MMRLGCSSWLPGTLSWENVSHQAQEGFWEAQEDSWIWAREKGAWPITIPISRMPVPRVDCSCYIWLSDSSKGEVAAWELPSEADASFMDSMLTTQLGINQEPMETSVLDRHLLCSLRKITCIHALLYVRLFTSKATSRNQCYLLLFN